MSPTDIISEMKHLKVDLPTFFEVDWLPCLSKGGLGRCDQNIRFAREELVTALSCGGMSVPRGNELLYEWQGYTKRIADGMNVETNVKQLDPNSRVETLNLESWYSLRHIMYSHKQPLANIMTLWACFYVLIMGQPLGLANFVSQTALYDNIYRLHLIDQAIESEEFAPWIKQRTENGFMRLYFSSSDDSEFYDRNRHVVILSTNARSTSPLDVDPSFRHVTSSVNMCKSSNAKKNADAIMKLFADMEVSMHYGGGCNDNASDAQKEIRVTFEEIMAAIDNCSEEEAERLRALLYENGVRRRPIAFGDPYHISNLCVTRASIFAFGDVEKGDHSQVHHRQLLQSIHSLHSSDKAFSQKMMDRVMAGATESVRVTSKRERVQRWLVNQRNSKDTLSMIAARTTDDVSAVVAWALVFANESRSSWKIRVGREVATWVMMPEIMLGLQFEAEIGSYFEEVYAWHNRPGPLNKRSGFRMLEIFDLYLGFELPWWNQVTADPASKLPKTMKYLEENFHGEEKEFRRKQIMRGLNAGREELITMTTKYLFRAPLMFLLLCHREQGAPFLRALLSVIQESPQDDMNPVMLIHDEESTAWGRHEYDRNNPRPDNERHWYNVLKPQTLGVVHWWQQLGLNRQCLVSDLQRLSNRSTPLPLKKDQAPLLAFKDEYKILFECLHAAFGLMMSNSRLCEQIHGMMRHGLRSQQGMDHVDAQNTYSVRHDYRMRQERIKSRMDSLPSQPSKKRRTIDHNTTKGQAQHLSQQLAERVRMWARKARTLLSRPGHGIPSVTQISKAGRRAQDKANVDAQIEAEKEKVANLRREEVTPAMIIEDAKSEVLSNDRIMRLGDERLGIRVKLAQISRSVFWKDEIVIPNGVPALRHVMKVAWKSMPFLHMVVPRMVGLTRGEMVKELKAPKLARVKPLAIEKSRREGISISDAVEELMKRSFSDLFGPHAFDELPLRQSLVKPVKNITEARAQIALYLARMTTGSPKTKKRDKITGTAKNIIQFMYGTPDNPAKRTPARERTLEVADILDTFKLLRVVDGAAEGEMERRPEELEAVSMFTKTDEHYTYTLDDEEEEDDDVTPDDDDGGGDEEDEENDSDEDSEDSDDALEDVGGLEQHFTAIT